MCVSMSAAAAAATIGRESNFVYQIRIYNHHHLTSFAMHKHMLLHVVVAAGGGDFKIQPRSVAPH